MKVSSEGLMQRQSLCGVVFFARMVNSEILEVFAAARLNFGELNVLVEADEVVFNSRPLTYVYDENGRTADITSPDYGP